MKKDNPLDPFLHIRKSVFIATLHGQHAAGKGMAEVFAKCHPSQRLSRLKKYHEKNTKEVIQKVADWHEANPYHVPSSYLKKFK